jgi:glycosyltransferase involved in cell wall biosynthesis/GT2 family glycosyltransferase
MRIGIELRQIVPGESGGIVPLLEGVCTALFADHPEHPVSLFCTAAHAGLFPALPPHVERVILPTDGFFRRLAEEVPRRRLDVLFRSFPQNAAAGLPPSRQVVLVPDLQHEFFPQFFSPQLLPARRATFNRALAEAGAIATLSEYVRKTIREHPCTRCGDIFLLSPALCAGGPVPAAADLTGAARAALPDRPFFLYPANVWPHKNHRRVLEAFGLLLRHAGEPVELILTGHPAGWAELAADFPRLPVRHLGFVSRPFLQLLLARARALVFFSLFEGFGMPLLEAFHAGTPVVCSNTTSLPEVGGDAVLSCDPCDAPAMSEAMLRVLQDEGLRAHFAARGRERLHHYSWRQSALNLVEACGRVAGRPVAEAAQPPVILRLRTAVRARLRSYYHPITHGLTRQVHGALLPRLGNLSQYPPRPLAVPRRYHTIRPPEPAPLISLVTPSYNQAAFLKQTIRSVLAQEYPRLEYIIQDGGSTDATPAVLERYRGMLAHVESQPDRGQAHALNRGFRRATGDILAYLNSDDLFLPGALAYVARYFALHRDVDVVYSHRVIIDADDREVGRWVLPPHDDGVLLWQDYVPQETLFWRRSVWERAGARLDESYHFALDWDLLVRFREAGARFARVPRFLAAFRIHPQQKTSARLIDLGVPESQRIRARCHGRLVRQDEIRQHVRTYLRRHVLYHQLYRLGLLAC